MDKSTATEIMQMWVVEVDANHKMGIHVAIVPSGDTYIMIVAGFNFHDDAARELVQDKLLAAKVTK